MTNCRALLRTLPTARVPSEICVASSYEYSVKAERRYKRTDDDGACLWYGRLDSIDKREANKKEKRTMSYFYSRDSLLRSDRLTVEYTK